MSESVAERCFTKAVNYFTFPCFCLDSTLIFWSFCLYLVWRHQSTDDIKQLLTGHLIDRQECICIICVKRGLDLSLLDLSLLEHVL